MTKYGDTIIDCPNCTEDSREGCSCKNGYIYVLPEGAEPTQAEYEAVSPDEQYFLDLIDRAPTPGIKASLEGIYNIRFHPERIQETSAQVRARADRQRSMVTSARMLGRETRRQYDQPTNWRNQ